MNEKYYRYYRVVLKDFSFDVCVSFNKNINRQKKKDKITRKIKSQIKYEHFYNLINKYADEYIESKYQIDINENINNMENINKIWNYDKPSYKVIDIIKLSECEGCRIDAPGQNDHMEPGGCLYQDRRI